jgi:precorrin-6B methylase 2
MIEQIPPTVLSLITDPGWDPASMIEPEHTRALHEIVDASGEAIEGNLFTLHQQHPLPEQPEPSLRGKRRNFALYVTGGASLLEIGFNAGHSCLLALSVNPTLRYVGVDLGEHAYTEPCFRYLHSVFPGRVELVTGDSREVLPLAGQFDRFHMDGGHGLEIAASDLRAVISMACPDATILVDDINQHHISAICDWHELQGDLASVAIGSLWTHTGRHQNKVFRIAKAT